MEPTEERVDQRGGPSNRREFTIGTAVPIAALVFTVFAWGHTVFVGLVDWLVDMDRDVAINSERVQECDKRFDRQFSEILANRNDIRKAERDLADLRSVPQSRADPFTGSQGRELQQRVDNIEQQLKP